MLHGVACDAPSPCGPTSRQCKRMHLCAGIDDSLIWVLLLGNGCCFVYGHARWWRCARHQLGAQEPVRKPDKRSTASIIAELKDMQVC